MWLTADDEGMRMERMQYYVMSLCLEEQYHSLVMQLLSPTFVEDRYRMCISWRRLLIFLKCLQKFIYIF